MSKLSKLITAVILIFVLSAVPVISCFASANSLPAYYSGTVDYLIDIRNPETIVSTTTNRNCVISAVAVKGTKVTLYAYNSATGTYEVLKNAYGEKLETYVGSSGLYVQQITLKDGLNSIMVVANSSSVTYEVVKLEISLLNKGYMDNVNAKFKSNGIGVTDIFR
ncbi:MAG: hypothetical protein E7395_05315 [Ruminococcaceae bacterium]|nr:hypothetical protein [Oscillospiraceae bacterium]